MKSKKMKKGFTLVELVVVIAVIGILAGVSVATYFGVVESSKKSNDTALVSEINRILKVEETLNGKPKTMHQALQAVENNGFNIEKITPTSSKNEFVWNKDQNEFFILSVDELNTQDANPNNWIIVDEESEVNKYTDKYSIYASNELTSTSLSVKNGFDAGYNTNIANVLYKNDGIGKTVDIRTIGGKLSVDGAKDTVYHYGNGNDLNIINVDKNSYHEFGSFVSANIKNGHLVVEEGAAINAVVVDKENEKKVSIETKNQSGIKAVYASEDFAVNGSSIKPTSFVTNENLQGYQLVSSFEELKTAITNKVDKVALGKDIIINQDITKENKYSSDFVINNKILINLNGNNISSTHNIAIGHTINTQVFNVSKGELTLTGLGTIEQTITGNNMGWNAASCVIATNGTLNVDGPVTLIQHGGTDMAYVVDHRAWGLETVKSTFKNATLINETYRTIRIFGNRSENKHVIEVNDSSIIAYKNSAIWKQYEKDVFELRFNSGLIESKNRSALNGINKKEIKIGTGKILDKNIDVTNQYK